MNLRVIVKMSVAAAMLLMEPAGWAQAPGQLTIPPAETSPKSPIAPEELRSVKNISPLEDKDDIPKQVGKIVRLRINGRPNMPTGRRGEQTVAWVSHAVVKNFQGRVGNFHLYIPPEGNAWFGKLAIDQRDGNSQFVYVRVIDFQTGEALGTKIVNGLKGPSLVW